MVDFSFKRSQPEKFSRLRREYFGVRVILLVLLGSVNPDFAVNFAVTGLA